MAKKKKKGKGLSSKVITIILSTLLVIFVLGHLSVLLNSGEVEGMDFFQPLLTHIKEQPFNFIAVNPYVAYFGGLSYLLFFVISISKQTVPQAEMKGQEHGSNDFQTNEERLEFLENNTTEILELDEEAIRKWCSGKESG